MLASLLIFSQISPRIRQIRTKPDWDEVGKTFAAAACAPCVPLSRIGLNEQLLVAAFISGIHPHSAAHRAQAAAANVLPTSSQSGFVRICLILGEIWEKMSKLANMFAVLNLDADDDREEVEEPASTKKEAAAATTDKLDRGRQNHTMIVNYDGGNLASSSSDYKMPLVWVDLEMTGLDVTKDRILEIACIITDGKLTKRIEGPDLVIRQSKECLDDMNEWCKIHHGTSGLTEQVLQSDISEHDAEKQVLDFIKRYIGSVTPLMAGNSVYMDLLFLKKYMPQLAAIFSHVIVDVSSIAALCSRWFPKERKEAPKKVKNHRAMDDIRESIRELQYYKENIFKSRKSK